MVVATSVALYEQVSANKKKHLRNAAAIVVFMME
jgi:hypothetical protein